MGLLSLIVIGFVLSGIDRLFFNDGLDTEFPDLSTLITQSTYEKNTGHKIEVEVLNGCDIPKLALMYTHYLRSEGIDVAAYKNADNSNYIETKILHHRGEIERALALANIMMIDKNNIFDIIDTPIPKHQITFTHQLLPIGLDFYSLRIKASNHHRFYLKEAKLILFVFINI